jgi:hypothetical protein
MIAGGGKHDATHSTIDVSPFHTQVVLASCSAPALPMLEELRSVERKRERGGGENGRIQ